MTVMIGVSAPAPPPADSAPPTNPSTSDGPSSFGPALSRAREEAAGSDGGAEQDSIGAARDEAGGERITDTAFDSGVVNQPDRPSEVDDATPVEAERTSGQKDEAGEETMLEAHAPELSTPTAAFTNASPAIDPTILDHPTAKGEVGAGGPSTDPTVEAAATPDTTEAPSAATPSGDVGRAHPLGADPATAIGHQLVEGQSVSSSSLTTNAANGERRNAEVAGAGALASTSVDELSNVIAEDGASPLDQPTVPVLTSEVGPRGVDLGDQIHAAAAQVAKTVDGVTNTSSSGAAASGMAASGDTRVETGVADAEVAVVETTSTMPVENPEGPPPAVASTSSSQRSDTVVVLANEAGVESIRPVSTPAATPTPGPLESAQGNLWEDVRLAFDRIRSSGDVQEVRIRLRPAELGELMVQVKTQGDHVAVRLIASSSAAQQTLIDDRLRLATELARAGFDEGSVDISQHESGSPANGDQGPSDRRDGRTVAEPDSEIDGRPAFERRDPIRTESVFRPGRHAYSTINLTL